MNALTDALRQARKSPDDFRPLRVAAKDWALWALDNLNGESLVKAMDVSLALVKFADTFPEPMDREDLTFHQLCHHHLWNGRPLGPSATCSKCGVREDGPMAGQNCSGVMNTAGPGGPY